MKLHCFATILDSQQPVATHSCSNSLHVEWQPRLFMLLALVFRGVAFEFRYRDAETPDILGSRFLLRLGGRRLRSRRRSWRLHPGSEVEGRHFSGHSLDCFTPFSLLTGVALVFGYALLGAGWLVLKTEDPLQEWARRLGRFAFLGVLVAIAAVSIWTPFHQPQIAEPWFGWPNIVFLAPVPIVTALCLGRVAGAQRQDFAGRALPLGRRSLRHVLSRTCDQPFPDDRSLQIYHLGSRLLAENPSLHADRDGIPAAGDPDLHRLVVLGLSGQSAGRLWVLLTSAKCANEPNLLILGTAQQELYATHA